MGVALLVICAAATAGAAETTTKKPAVKISASQLMLRLDAIEKKLDNLAAKPGAGTGAAAAAVDEALRQFGYHHARAMRMRLASSIVKGVCNVTGLVLAADGAYRIGNQISVNTSASVTTSGASLSGRLSGVSPSNIALAASGVGTIILGNLVGYVLDLIATGRESTAGAALRGLGSAQPAN